MQAYVITLFVHSYLRWVVLVLGVLVFAKAVVTRQRGPGDARLHRALIGVVDLQFLIGLALYVFLSPTTSVFFADPGAAMKVPDLRFFGVEHITGMVLGLAVLHMGRPRKSPTRRRVLITVGLFLALVLASIPWPFQSAGRPLLRGISSEPAPAATLQRHP